MGPMAFKQRIKFKMIHTIKKIPNHKDLKGTDRISYYWFHLMINNPIKWMLSTFFLKIKCKLLGIKIKNVRCYGNVSIYRAPLSSIVIGDGTQIISSFSRGNACSLYAKARIRTLTPDAKVIIGENCGFNGVSITARTKRITIDNNCRIGPNVVIVDSDFHAHWPAEERRNNPGFEYDDDVFIGENVWIGMNSIILKGAKIGKNSIIGAGSVITGNIEENCIAVGIPAQKIKSISFLN